jgi:acyl carrier protein
MLDLQRWRSPECATDPTEMVPMTQEEIAQRIKEDLGRITGIPVAAIADEASFQKDLGLDSLSLLELVVHLEYGFKIKVPEDQLSSLRTVNETARYVHDHLPTGG